MNEREIIMAILERLDRTIYSEGNDYVVFANSSYGESIEIEFDENGNVTDIWC